jgi:uncharacterized protein (DUF433 family)
VTVAALFENLEDGALVSQFVEWFPGVALEQVRTVLEHAALARLILFALPSVAVGSKPNK